MSAGGTRWRFLVNHCLDALANIIEVAAGTEPEAVFRTITTMDGRFSDDQVRGFELEMWVEEIKDWVDVAGCLDELVKCRKVRVVRPKASPLAAHPAVLPPLMSDSGRVAEVTPATLDQGVVAPVINGAVGLAGPGLPPVAAPLPYVSPNEDLAQLPELSAPSPAEAALPRMPAPITIKYDEVLAACASLPPSATVIQVEDAISLSIRDEIRSMIRVAKEHGAQVMSTSPPLPREPKPQQLPEEKQQGFHAMLTEFIVKQVGSGIASHFSDLSSQLKTAFPKLCGDKTRRDAAINGAAEAGLIRIHETDRFGQRSVTIPASSRRGDVVGYELLTQLLGNKPAGMTLGHIHTQLLLIRPDLYTDKQVRDGLIQMAIDDCAVLRLNPPKEAGAVSLILPTEATPLEVVQGILFRTPSSSMEYGKVVGKMKHLRPDIFSEKAKRDSIMDDFEAKGVLFFSKRDAAGHRVVSVPHKEKSRRFDALERLLRDRPEGIAASFIHPELRNEQPDKFMDKSRRDAYVQQAVEEHAVLMYSDGPSCQMLTLPENASVDQLIEGIVQAAKPSRSVNFTHVVNIMKKLRHTLHDQDAAIMDAASRSVVVLSQQDDIEGLVVSLPTAVAAKKNTTDPAARVADVVAKHRGPYRISLLNSRLIADHREQFADRDDRKAAITAAENRGLIRIYDDEQGVTQAVSVRRETTTTEDLRPLSATIKNRDVKAVVKTIEDHGENGVMQHSTVGQKMSQLNYYADKSRRDNAIQEALDLGFVIRREKAHGQADLRIVDRRKKKGAAASRTAAAPPVSNPKRQRSPDLSEVEASLPPEGALPIAIPRLESTEVSEPPTEF